MSRVSRDFPPIRYRQSDGRWITIGSDKSAPPGEKGGTPVYIGESGRIEKGPDKLEGASLDDLKKPKTQKPKAPKAPKVPSAKKDFPDVGQPGLPEHINSALNAAYAAGVPVDKYQFQMASLGKDVAGECSISSRSGVLQINLAKNIDKMDLRGAEGSGWLSAGGGTIQGTLTHEVGHAEHFNGLVARHAEHFSKLDYVANSPRAAAIRRAAGEFVAWTETKRQSYTDVNGDYVSRRVFEAAASQVSRYAKTCPVEFVAEVYCGMNAGGVVYPESVMKMYKAFGGPK